MNRALHAARRSLLVLCQLAVVLLCASSALAAGRVEWKSKTVKEREDKSWRLEVSIFMPKAPDVAHVPMKFEFQPTAYYARDMTDGDKLVEHTVPLTDRQSLIESVDVGFLDSGSGKIEPRTRFSFKVTRAHGYAAVCAKSSRTVPSTSTALAANVPRCARTPTPSSPGSAANAAAQRPRCLPRSVVECPRGLPRPQMK